jgi:hypothetical protein
MIQKMERTRAILVEGWQVTPAEASELEAKLAQDSENLPLRLRLMSYYTQHLMNEKHAEHLFWLIEHHPDEDAFYDAEIITRIPVSESDGKSSVHQARLLALWKVQAQRFPDNARVLRNAASAVSFAEPELAVQYVKAARQSEPGNPEWTKWLAKTYAVGIRWTYWDGKSSMTFTGDVEDYRYQPFTMPASTGQSVKTEVETSADAALVGAVGDMLLREARLLASRSNADGSSIVTPDVEPARRFGEMLAERARKLQAMAR